MNTLRFTPSNYNTTARIVRNVWYGKLTTMANGDVIIEYKQGHEIISLFYCLRLHAITPDDLEPRVTATDLRNRRNSQTAWIIIRIIQIVIGTAALIYAINLFIHVQ
jgi:hypothetical protein